MPDALACLRLVLQSLCDFFSHSVLCWTSLTGPFLSAGKGVLRYSVPNFESGLLFLNQCGEWFSLPAQSFILLFSFKNRIAHRGGS